MRLVGKAIVVALLISVSLGLAVGLGLIRLGGVDGADPEEVAGLRGALQLLHAALVLTGTTTVPLGFIGGVVAGATLQRERQPLTLWLWLVRGIGLGSFVGAMGAPATPWLFWGAGQSPAAGAVLAMFSLAGAAGGAMVGGLVAVWCYRVQQKDMPGGSE